MSTFPPAKCGIAEYTYDLVTSVMSVSNKVDFIIFRMMTPEGASSESYPLPRYAEIVDVGDTLHPNYKKVIDTLSNEGKVDILHIQHEFSLHRDNEKFVSFLKEVKRLCNTLVITLHTVRHALHYPGIDEFQRKVCDIADVVIVHSILQENELLLQGVDPSKIVRIPHGTRIVERRVSKLDAAHELGLEDLVNKNVLLFQGFLRKDKGLHLLINSLNILISELKRHDVVLLIAGQLQGVEENRPYVEQVFRDVSPNLAKHIVIVNKYLSRKEIDLFYAIADVILFPYVDVRGDIGVSGALHWAMGSFKPLVCSRVPRLVEFYELAPRLTFPPHNAESLAAKVNLVLENYDEALQYLNPVFNYAVETSWINIAKIYAELYRGEKPYMIDVHMFKLRRREKVEELPALPTLARK